MARQISKRNLGPVLAAAKRWIDTCLVGDGALFADTPRWALGTVEEVYDAFVKHPDFGDADFMTKLKGQMKGTSPAAQQLVGEMLWVLLLFPSNMKARTKRRQVRETWELSRQSLAESNLLLSDDVLVGVGSGGPGIHNYRPDEFAFVIEITRSLKQNPTSERQEIFSDYDTFMNWIVSVPQKGHRQFRHMLRYFAFPDRVERMSSNRDRWKILEAFGVTTNARSSFPTDRLLDEALFALRNSLQKAAPSTIFDFYEPPLKERWAAESKVTTMEGDITVTIPTDDDEADEEQLEQASESTKSQEARQSFQIQAKLAEIGAIMGFKVWLPPADRGRVRDLMSVSERPALIDTLPGSYNKDTNETIRQIDVIWLRRQAIARAFEVEHTTAIYSGLLRMADLLALQPNISIHLYIVAPEGRREKVFHETTRPVFAVLESGPLEHIRSFPIQDGIPKSREQCESLVAIATGAEHGASLQPGFA